MTNLQINDKKYVGPDSWDTLTSQRQFLRLFKLSRVSTSAKFARFLALKIVYGIPKHVVKLFFDNPDRIPEESDFLSPSDRAILLGVQLMETVEWVWDKVPMSRWYYPSVLVFLKKFKGPEDGFGGLTFGQYMFSERFFDALQNENEDYKTNLQLFLATLYRPGSQKIFDPGKIEQYAKWLQWIPKQKQEAIVFNYAGLRYQLTKDFPEVFPKARDKESESLQAKNASGWLDVALSLTGKDLTMLKAYESADLWLVMKVLTNVIRENKAMEELRNKK
jgi:hypothetical protein